ncbi:fungal-specific transcription factor domain-containing protein [Colletotrichum godetiae]|uniref:Fungal-specific transcription factor domain-containing protein n=1 Tax=Colletotrichum godetiae TaxID=1209918 RepID=A0AAJ0EPP4_9PEZI|nr:fungal-specific transcription factor domain-containing protein [Colletotrichum godetiae]KAK1659941.1 fungal-specific transcription factor domain-containing protein [Colletotrichum godetiae]
MSSPQEGVPKKRGPKKESLSALIKRIDGLEELLKSDKTPTPPGSDAVPADFNELHVYSNNSAEPCGSASSDVSPYSAFHEGSFGTNNEFPSIINAEGLVDTYFTHFHQNPYRILDEEVTRQKLRNNKMPKSLLYAICAVSTRFSEQPSRGPSSHVSAETYASWALKHMDIGDTTIENCQALLLLVTAFAAMGNGRKAYSVLSQAVGAVLALELYEGLEQPDDYNHTQSKMKKRLFWTCYVMNVFVSTWLERPSLIDDALIKTTIQSSRQISQAGWPPNNECSLTVEPEPVSECADDPDNGLQKLVWIAHILSDANRYLLITDPTTQAAFAHRHKIRHDLDLWAAEISRNPDSLYQDLRGAEANTMLECQIIYHLVHCLIYRPLLPLHLSEPAGAMMIQHWVIEATEVAFRHATAIIELIDHAMQTRFLELPAFVSYCIFTAGTIHVHGMHYTNDHQDQGAGIGLPSFASSPMAAETFATSAELVSKCLYQLSAIGNEVESSRTSRAYLDELTKEHAKMLGKGAAGYIPSQTNKFFNRYPAELRQRIQGFHFGPLPPSMLLHPYPPETPDSGPRKMMIPSRPWGQNMNPGSATTEIPVVSSNTSMGQRIGQPQGHSRSYSDSTPMTQTYSFATNAPVSQRPLPAWLGFQDATPRQIITHGTPMLGPSSSSQLTSPVAQQGPTSTVERSNWSGAEGFGGRADESLTYDIVAGAVTTAGPMYRPEGAYVQYQNFSVL